MARRPERLDRQEGHHRPAVRGRHRAVRALWLLLPGLGVLWLAVLYAPLHQSLVPHAVAMTFGGTLVGLAHLANLRLNHGHVHDATCAH